MKSQLKRLIGKEIKIVYKEREGVEPYISEGKCVSANHSFVVVKGKKNNFAHFIAISAIVRISERRTEE